MMIKVTALIFICFSACIGMAQQNQADSVKVKKLTDSIVSPTPSLTYQEYTAYKTGKNMAMAKVAEVNNYPDPAQVLDMQKELKLSENQKSQLKTVNDNLKRKAEEMGNLILKEEKKLNDLFASAKVNEGSLIYYTNKSGLFQGELRNAHLRAYLKAHAILTADQLKKYNKLRVYSGKGISR